MPDNNQYCHFSLEYLVIFVYYDQQMGAVYAFSYTKPSFEFSHLLSSFLNKKGGALVKAENKNYKEGLPYLGTTPKCWETPICLS